QLYFAETDERMQGDSFERLMLQFFCTDVTYADDARARDRDRGLRGARVRLLVRAPHQDAQGAPGAAPGQGPRAAARGGRAAVPGVLRRGAARGARLGPGRPGRGGGA